MTKTAWYLTKTGQKRVAALRIISIILLEIKKKLQGQSDLVGCRPVSPNTYYHFNTVRNISAVELTCEP